MTPQEVARYYMAVQNCLHEIEEIAGERADVKDGKDGNPVPDDWMRVMLSAQEALHYLVRILDPLTVVS